MNLWAAFKSDHITNEWQFVCGRNVRTHFSQFRFSFSSFAAPLASLCCRFLLWLAFLFDSVYLVCLVPGELQLHLIDGGSISPSASHCDASGWKKMSLFVSRTQQSRAERTKN